MWTEQQLTKHLERRGVPGAPNTADVSAPPFALPDIVLDLPPPISVNRLWRSQKGDTGPIGVRKSGPYKDWIKRADAMLLELGQLKGVRPIAGRFTALLVVKRSALDLDNNAKCWIFCKAATSSWTTTFARKSSCDGVRLQPVAASPSVLLPA